MPVSEAYSRTLDRIADRLVRFLPDDCHAGAVYPVERRKGWNLSTLHIYGHGDFSATIMFYREPTPELLTAIGKAFCGE